MELTAQELDNKVKALQQESAQYAMRQQEEINRATQQVQKMVKDAQKRIDVYEGKIAAFIELREQLFPGAVTPDQQAIASPLPVPRSTEPIPGTGH